MLTLLRQHALAGWLVLIVIITAIVYSPTIHNDFVDYDDLQLVAKNGAVTELSPRTLSFVFTTFDPELYIPLTFVSYQVEGALFGIRPDVVHMTNLLLHLLNSMLVGWVVYGLTQRKGVAAASAALFALHPINSETVLWASARKDLLSSFFFLGSLGCYLSFRQSDRRSGYFASLLLFLLALLSKVSVAPIPLILLLCDWLQDGHLLRRWKEKTPFFLLSIVFVIIALVGKTETLGASDTLTNAFLGAKSAGVVLWKLFAPFHFSVVYPQEPLMQASRWPFVLSTFVVAVLLSLAFILRRRRIITWGIGFFFLLLLPSFTNFSKNGILTFASDHYAYLPSLGIFIPLILLSDGMPGQQWKRRATIAMFFGILVGLAMSARSNVPVWKSTESLFRNMLSLYPRSALAHNNLGVVLENLGDGEAAIREYEAASTNDPTFIPPLRNTARILWARGDRDHADQFLRAAMQVVARKTVVIGSDLLPFYDRAEHLDETDNGDEALRVLQQAVRLGPGVARAHFALGVAYQKRGNTAEALQELEIARSLQPHNADLQERLATLYVDRGRLKEAEKALELVLWLDPTYPKAEEHLENIRDLLAD